MISFLGEHSSGLNNIFCILIIVYALKSFKDLLPTREMANELKGYLGILKDIKQKKEDFEDSDLESLYEEYEVSVSAKNFKHIGENIADYNKDLKKKNFKNVKSENYFNEISVIDKAFNLNALNQKGPTLVGLGVLGTFAGLFFSLGQIQIGVNASQVNVIDRIIPGMSLAFLTSLLGMFTSIIYTRCQKTWIGGAIREIGQIDYQLGVIFPRTNTSDTVLKIEENLEKLSQSLIKELGNSVVTAIDGTKSALFGTFEKSMDKNMGKMTNDISSLVSKGIGQIFNQELIDSFKQIQTALDETKTSIDNNNIQFVKIVKDLPAVIQKFETMNGVSDSIFENAKKSMQEYDKYMKGTEDFLLSMSKMSLLQSQIDQSVEVLTTTTAKSYNNLEESTNKNYETINKTTMALAEQHRGINTELKESLVQMLNKNEELLKLMNGLVDKNSQNIVELDKTMVNSVKLITDGMEDRRKDFAVQHDKITQNQEKLEDEIGKALNEYDKTVSNVTGQIKDIILNLKDMVTSKDDE
ncbi:MAG: MotA/TolQ/ExbB proton channel family protein [Cetobacterium sp.]